MHSFSLFRPARSFGALSMAGVTFVCLALAVLSIGTAFGMGTDFDLVWPLLAGAALVVLALLFAYWAWACWMLSYLVDRNALEIRWGGVRQTVPLGEIEALVPAAAEDNTTIAGLNWPHCHIGRGNVPD